MKTIEKVIEQTVKTYIAEDGTEFTSESECKEYERMQMMADQIAEAEKLRVNELDGVIPLLQDGANPNNTFRWYQLENERDFEILKKACENGYLHGPDSYPELYCVEFVDGNPYDAWDTYGCTFTQCKEESEQFWNWMGYKVTLEKIES